MKPRLQNALVLFVLLAGCDRDHSAWVIVDWTTVGAGDSFEIGVADSTACPSQAEFIEQAGSGFLYHAAGEWADRNDAPALGKLPDRNLSFAALLRDDTCSVLGYGCVLAKPSESDAVTIHVDFPTAPAACTGRCTNGLCDLTQAPEDAGADAPSD